MDDTTAVPGVRDAARGWPPDEIELLLGWAAELPGLPPGLVARIAALPGRPAVVAAAAARPDLPAADRTRLARHPDATVRAGAARNPSATEGELAAHARDGDPEVRMAAAGHPRLPVAGVTALAADPVTDVRLMVAARDDLPDETVTLLAGDRRGSVVVALACHARAAPGVQRRLWGRVRHRDAIRRALAANPALIPDLVAEAVRARRTGLREEVAGNPALPPDAAAELARDRRPEVRAALLANPRFPPDLLPVVLDGCDLTPAAPLRPPWLRTAPVATALALAGSAEPVLRQAALWHPALPAATVLALLDDPDPGVAEQALGHPGVPPGELRRRARHHATGPGGGPDAGEIFTSVLENDACPPDVLAAAAVEGTPADRLTVADRPALPLPALRRLLVDPDPRVRENAWSNPAVPAGDVEALVQVAEMAEVAEIRR